MAFKPEAMDIMMGHSKNRSAEREHGLSNKLSELMSSELSHGFEGDEELLSCLESLSRKLRRLEYLEAC